VNYDLSSLIPQWVKSEEDIVFIFDSFTQGGHPRPAVWGPKFQGEFVQRMLELNYNHEEDFFVVTGHFIPVTTAMATLGMMFDEFTILQFSNSDRGYSSIKMEYSNADITD
jgi:hypothetical protein